MAKKNHKKAICTKSLAQATKGMLKGTKFTAQEIEDWLDNGELD